MTNTTSSTDRKQSSRIALIAHCRAQIQTYAARRQKHLATLQRAGQGFDAAMAHADAGHAKDVIHAHVEILRIIGVTVLCPCGDCPGKRAAAAD